MSFDPTLTEAIAIPVSAVVGAAVTALFGRKRSAVETDSVAVSAAHEALEAVQSSLETMRRDLAAAHVEIASLRTELRAARTEIDNLVTANSELRARLDAKESAT